MIPQCVQHYTLHVARVSILNAKRERCDDEEDADAVSSQSRSSKRTRMGSIANEMHAEENVVDMVMEAPLQEKQQNIKFMMQLREVGRKQRLEKRNWISLA